MSSRRIVTVAVVLATASGVGWALIELGRQAERMPVPPIVIGEGGSRPRPGGEDPGTTNPDDEGQNPEPGGSGGNPSSGAAPPPAPPPPPAGDDDGDDDRDEDADD